MYLYIFAPAKLLKLILHGVLREILILETVKEGNLMKTTNEWICYGLTLLLVIKDIHC